MANLPGLGYALTVLFCTLGAGGMVIGGTIEGFALKKVKDLNNQPEDATKTTASKVARFAWLAMAAIGASVAALGTFLFAVCGLELIFWARIPGSTLTIIETVGGILAAAGLFGVQWKAIHWAFKRESHLAPGINQAAAS